MGRERRRMAAGEAGTPGIARFAADVRLSHHGAVAAAKF